MAQLELDISPQLTFMDKKEDIISIFLCVVALVCLFLSIYHCISCIRKTRFDLQKEFRRNFFIVKKTE